MRMGYRSRFAWMKAYFTRAPLQSTPRLFQDVSCFLDATKLSAQLQDLLPRIQQFVRSLLGLGRPSSLHPLVQAMARDAETSGAPRTERPSLKALIDRGRIRLEQLVFGTG